MQADDWELPIVEAGACPWPQFGGKGISTAIACAQTTSNG